MGYNTSRHCGGYAQRGMYELKCPRNKKLNQRNRKWGKRKTPSDPTSKGKRERLVTFLAISVLRTSFQNATTEFNTFLNYNPGFSFK